MDYMTMLLAWREAKDTLRTVKAEELRLRKLLFSGAFRNPVEGTNTATLVDGTVIKGVFKLSYTLDQAALPAVSEQLADVWDTLVSYKAELSVPAYRALTPAQVSILSSALTITPATPTLEVIPPSRSDT